MRRMWMDRSRGTFVVSLLHGVPQDLSMVCFVSRCGVPCEVVCVVGAAKWMRISDGTKFKVPCW